MPQNIFATGMDAFDSQVARGRDFRQDRGRIAAGRSLAGGDRGGAMAALGEAGDVQGVRTLQGDQQEDADRAAAAQQAANAEEQAAGKRKAEAVLAVTEHLGTVPEGQRKAALMAAYPLFQAAQVDTAMFDGLGEADLSTQNLQMFHGKMTEAYKQIFHNPEHGIYGVQPDGGVKTLKAFPRKPLVVPQTSDVLMPNDGEDDLSGGMGQDTLGGGQGQDTMRGGDRSVPGYTMVRPGRAPATGGGGGATNKPPAGYRWTKAGGLEAIPGGPADQATKVPSRLSATVIKMQTDLLSDLKSASTVNSVIQRAINQIDGGKLNFSLAGNIFNTARNAVGVSSPESSNFNTFRADLEKMRNDSLRLNKGVQTEGDAQRAWNELIKNISDERLVRQRLVEIKDLNEQAIALRKDLVAQAREDSGFPPLDTSRYEARPSVNDPGQRPPPAKMSDDDLKKALGL